MAGLKSLGRELVEAIGSTSAPDTLAEYVELGLDSLLDEGVLKDIPVLGSLTSFARAGMAISDGLLLRKISRFLTAISDLSVTERLGMVQKLKDDPEYARAVGDHVIEVLDRVDSKRKPEMVAAVFAAYARGEVGALLLHRLVIAIERFPEIDFHRLRSFVAGDASKAKPDALLFQELVSAGLAVGESVYGGLAYKPTEAARTLVKLEIDRVGV